MTGAPGAAVFEAVLRFGISCFADLPLCAPAVFSHFFQRIRVITK